MALFLSHAFILLLASLGAARPLVRSVPDRILAASLLTWGNIVAASLLLAALHRLGQPAWFFLTSVTLALATWLALRRTQPRPAGDARAEDSGPVPSALLVVVFILTLLPIAWANLRVAGTYEPNNYDSLTYHLPRAMFYLGQDTLAHFDTGNARQIYFPFNYTLLQLFALIYSPPLQCLTFLNLAAWAVAGLAVYRLSRLCACTTNSALLVSWLALTSTQVLAQATSTTNDLPLGTGLLCALVFALRWRQSRQTRDALLAGLAAGLAAGTKLTVLFFAPPAGLLLLGWGYRHWRQGRGREFFAGVRAWTGPALLAFAVSAPFALINLAGKGQWMNKTYDYTLNRPFSFACAAQTAKAYLLQLFLEPLQRFTFDLKVTSQLNAWGERTFFPHWNDAYAFSPLYLFPPDLTEDHVWFGFTGPFIVLAAVLCLMQWRKVAAPVGWLAWIGLGWFASYFLLNKWSVYNQRYFVPAILVLSPCVAGVVDLAWTSRLARYALRCLLPGLALCSLWLAGVFLFNNTRRPFAPLWAGQPAPAALPALPPLLAQRLSAYSRININATDGNERIFLLMAQRRHQRFTSFEKTDPEAYNVFSEWGFSRKVDYRNIEQQPCAFTTVAMPTKRSAGVEFLGTFGEGTGAQDYYGVPPQAGEAIPTDGNRNVLVVLYRTPEVPNPYHHARIQVAGLNPVDQARLTVGVEYEDQTAETLADLNTSGIVPASITKPFRRITVRVKDQATGAVIGAMNIPSLIREKPPEYGTPYDPTTIFEDNLVANHVLSHLTAEGLANAEGPYPQWNLPLIRWAKAPVVRLDIPRTDDLVRLRLSFSLRLYARERTGIYVMLNGRPVKYYQVDDSTVWLDETLDFDVQKGPNVLEFRNVALGAKPDWLDYLERFPDVKAFVVSQKIPLEQGAREHYERFGKLEKRLLLQQHTTEPATAPGSLYYLFRLLKVEGYRIP